MEALRTSPRKVHSPYAELFGARELNRRSRCLIVVAHPNDEIVGSGCLIAKLPNVRILHVSHGAFAVQETQKAGFDIATERKRECLAALALAKVPSDRVVEFDLPQLEAPYKMVELTRSLLTFLQKNSSRIVLTHAYEGGHPDHDAVAFATHSAVRLLSQYGLKPPVIFEMAIYPDKNGLLKMPEFLHNPAGESTTLMLDSDALELKKRMFDCFKTQQQTLAQSPLGPEKFRQAPVYDFTRPPHDGKLHYEKLNLGVTGEQWRELAREAEQVLF
jgi:LmbE family N-acetylglucosaminyl deacetylase